MTATIKKVIDRCRKALELESEIIEVRIGIDDSFFKATFAEGETISLSKNSLKNDWDNLVKEIRELERLAPPNGDVKCIRDASPSDLKAKNPSDTSLTRPDQMLTDKEVMKDINDFINGIEQNSGVSPGTTTSGPGNDEIDPVNLDMENNIPPIGPNHPDMTSDNKNQNDDSKDGSKDGTDNLLTNDSNKNLVNKKLHKNHSSDNEINSKNKNEVTSENDSTQKDSNKKDSKINNNDSIDNKNLTNNNDKGAVGPIQSTKRQFNSDENSDPSNGKMERRINVLDSRMGQLEHMMDLTLNMTTKMHETMQTWLDRCKPENKAEANQAQAATKNHPGSKTTAMASVQFANSGQRQWVNERCYECDDYGHMKNECPLKGQGLRKCYECQKFTTHKAYECEKRLARSRGRGIAYSD
ncbi:putative uncharacterized protein DDB_G0286901 [Leptopilina boulardi]|uniref:putative uncharacterized protein DDB_G0286901 n=1 Tax=Leptopilina boulardi TaxID=63433 RepID=UPI0021F6092B|nr:putative uncharacterized protein DDB_G0286901 [Leptopilina boulardi]